MDLGRERCGHLSEMIHFAHFCCFPHCSMERTNTEGSLVGQICSQRCPGVCKPKLPTAALQLCWRERCKMKTQLNSLLITRVSKDF